MTARIHTHAGIIVRHLPNAVEFCSCNAYRPVGTSRWIFAEPLLCSKCSGSMALCQCCAARYLGLGDRSFRRNFEAGLLASIEYPHGGRRFMRADLDAFRDRHTTRPVSEATIAGNSSGELIDLAKRRIAARRGRR